MNAVTAGRGLAKEPNAMATYVVGFVLSVGLTLLAFWLVSSGQVTTFTGLWAIFGLALIQFCVQVLCFLHLGSDRKPRFKLMAFMFMLLVVLILAGGSLWIMDNLNYHMQPPLTPAQQKRYLHDNEGL
jgi:cytochrome o ubiquinol oxidase operon protein cyoD